MKMLANDAHVLAEDDLRRRVKRELRKRARGIRKATPAEACAERSRLIIEHLGEVPALKSARSVALFWPMLDRHEVDLRTLDEALRGRGARVAYPSIDADSEERRMSFHFVGDTAELIERGHGFAEPPDGATAIAHDLLELDVVVVPGLAMDPTGHRIGYGAGYYDGALAGTSVVKIGVIFDFELVTEVPATDGDVRVDWVVTDRRTVVVSTTHYGEPPCPT